MKLRRIPSKYGLLWFIAVPASFALLTHASAAQSSQGGQPSLAALRAGCSDDAAKFCAGVQPGGGRIVACLKQNQDSLSDKCRQAAGLPPKTASSSAPALALQPAPQPAPSAPTNAPATTPSAPSANSQSKPAKSAKATGVGPGPVAIGQDKFVERFIVDPDHENMRAIALHLPEKWRLESKIAWHYNWIENPIEISFHAENPDNAEAFFIYPLLRLEHTEVAKQLQQYDRGPKPKPGERKATGAIAMPPQPPLKALAMFIQNVRPQATNLKWVGQQDLPDPAKALKMDPWPGDHGYAIKIAYDLNGQPVEESFFGVYYTSTQSPESKSVGKVSLSGSMIQQTNWGFRNLQSFRAPAGTLDKRMPAFCLMSKSMAINPEWQKLFKAINDKMLADFNQKLQQGYDQIRASQAIMEQTQKQMAAFQANFDKQEAAMRSSPGFDDSWLRTDSGGSGSGSHRSSADHFDDLVRGVDTMNDPSTGGTTQLTNAGQYHFTDGFGNYRSTDDPNYTPEKAGEVGSWTQMTPAQ